MYSWQMYSYNISALEHIILEPHSRRTNRTMYKLHKSLPQIHFPFTSNAENKRQIVSRYLVSYALKALFAVGGWMSKQSDTELINVVFTLKSSGYLGPLLSIKLIFLVLSVRCPNIFFSGMSSIHVLLVQCIYNQTVIYLWMDCNRFIAKIILWWQVTSSCLMKTFKQLTIMHLKLNRIKWLTANERWTIALWDSIFVFCYASNADVISQRRPIAFVPFPIWMIERNAVFIMCIHHSVHHYGFHPIIWF